MTSSFGEVQTDDEFIFMNRLYMKTLSVDNAETMSSNQIASNNLLSIDNEYGYIACGVTNGKLFITPFTKPEGCLIIPTRVIQEEFNVGCDKFVFGSEDKISLYGR